MARPHPLRASWAATKKRLRQEELRRGAQAQAKWDAASAGHLRGTRTLLELHREAMELADEADNVRRSGDREGAHDLLGRALESERMAALRASEEPSRSVLLRSAASLALELKQLREAERMVALALSAEPPPVIAEELRDILEQVYFARQRPVVGLGIQGRERVTDSA